MPLINAYSMPTARQHLRRFGWAGEELVTGGGAQPQSRISKVSRVSLENEYDDEQEGLRARSEQAIGELAQALLDSHVLENAVAAAFGAREKALEAQQAAMAALNLPSASDVERLERRLRALSQRLDEVEDELDRASREVGGLRRELAAERRRAETDA
jgi:chromosome segregation ATPase